MQPKELQESRNRRIWDINPILGSRPIVNALVWVSADCCLMADLYTIHRSFSPSFLGVKLASCSATYHSHIGTSYRMSRQVHQNIGSEDVVLGVVNWTLEVCAHLDQTAVPDTLSQTGSEVSNRLN